MSFPELLLRELATLVICVVTFYVSLALSIGNTAQKAGAFQNLLEAASKPVILIVPVCLLIPLILHWTRLSRYQTVPLKVAVLLNIAFVVGLAVQVFRPSP